MSLGTWCQFRMKKAVFQVSHRRKPHQVQPRGSIQVQDHCEFDIIMCQTTLPDGLCPSMTRSYTPDIALGAVPRQLEISPQPSLFEVVQGSIYPQLGNNAPWNSGYGLPRYALEGSLWREKKRSSTTSCTTHVNFYLLTNPGIHGCRASCRPYRGAFAALTCFDCVLPTECRHGSFHL